MLSDVRQTIRDPGLGLLPGNTAGLSLKIGVSSLGIALAIVSLSTVSAVKDRLGSGALAESSAWHLATGGGGLLGMRAPASVAGTRSAVALQAGGTSSATAALSAPAGITDPADAFSIVLEVSRATAGLPLAVGAYRVSVDGGLTFGDEVSAAAPYTIPDSGVRITFAPGATGVSLVLGERFTATTTPALMSTVDLMAALDAAIASPREYEFVHVSGSVTPAQAAAVGVKMVTAESRHRYTHTILEARLPTAGETQTQYEEAVLTEYAGVASTRLTIVSSYSGSRIISQLTARPARRPDSWPYVSRLSQIPISESPANVGSGALPGLLVDDLGRDEFQSPGLDAGRFTTLRSHIGLSGVYVTQGRMLAPVISDFRYVETRRVMDAACRISRNAALPFLNSSVLVDPITGFIAETEARRIEAFIEAQLVAGLVSANHVSDVAVSVGRTNSILADETLYITVGIIPKGYARMIFITLGFRNPANEPTAPPAAPATAPA